MPEFKPKTVYVTYIASTPERMWEALTSSEFTRKYFWDRSIELEPKLGGKFALLLMPDGTVNVKGNVIAWDSPQIRGDLAGRMAGGVQQAPRMPRHL
jgi:uncharacterized protein YndB with AHSA1/START domain